MKINAHFHFHSVGQGLFYSGNINVMETPEKQTYNFVYDCGSNNSNALKDAILFHKSVVNKKKELDCLYISHFDKDHINGISELISNIIVKRVILPYLSPIERLTSLCMAGNPSEDYEEFLINPYTYLNDKSKIKEIILVGTSPKEEKKEEKKNLYEFETISEDKELEKEILKNEEIELRGTKIKTSKMEGRISFGGQWEFIYINSPEDKNKINEFKKRVLAKYNETFQSSNISNITQAVLLEIVNDQKLFKELKEMYKVEFSDLNNTSLLLYHGPIYPENFVLICSEKHYASSSWNPPLIHKIHRRSYNKKKMNTKSQLLTGDKRLSNNFGYILNAIDKERVDKILLIQVPHHGSEGYLDSQFVCKFKNSRLFPVSYGLNNQYGHPSSYILDTLLLHCKTIILINEIDKLSINYFRTR